MENSKTSREAHQRARLSFLAAPKYTCQKNYHVALRKQKKKIMFDKRRDLANFVHAKETKIEEKPVFCVTKIQENLSEIIGQVLDSGKTTIDELDKETRIKIIYSKHVEADLDLVSQILNSENEVLQYIAAICLMKMTQDMTQTVGAKLRSLEVMDRVEDLLTNSKSDVLCNELMNMFLNIDRITEATEGYFISPDLLGIMVTRCEDLGENYRTSVEWLAATLMDEVGYQYTDACIENGLLKYTLKDYKLQDQSKDNNILQILTWLLNLICADCHKLESKSRQEIAEVVTYTIKTQSEKTPKDESLISESFWVLCLLSKYPEDFTE